MQRGAGKLQRQGLDEGSEEPNESESRVKERVSRPRDSWRLPLGLGAGTPTARAACRGRAGGRKWRGRAGQRRCARGRAGSLRPARCGWGVGPRSRPAPPLGPAPEAESSARAREAGGQGRRGAWSGTRLRPAVSRVTGPRACGPGGGGYGRSRGRRGLTWLSACFRSALVPRRQTSAPVRASLGGADCFQSGLPSGRDFKRDSHAGQTDLKFPVG